MAGRRICKPRPRGRSVLCPNPRDTPRSEPASTPGRWGTGKVRQSWERPPESRLLEYFARPHGGHRRKHTGPLRVCRRRIGVRPDALSNLGTDAWSMIAPLPRAYDERPHGAIVAIVGGPQQTNLALAAAWLERGFPAARLSAQDAADLLAPLDTALLRLDVLPTLDGIEDGLDELAGLVRRGVRVLNPPLSIVAMHDKLRTASASCRALVSPSEDRSSSRATARRSVCGRPLVLKPRFGSWGEDVFLRERLELASRRPVRQIRDRPWFRRHGAFLQELVPSSGRDIRILVAGGPRRRRGPASRSSRGVEDERRTGRARAAASRRRRKCASWRSPRRRRSVQISSAIDLLPFQAGRS